MILSALNSYSATKSEDKKGFLSGFGLESTFGSTMGGVTNFIVGKGRITNIYSSDRKTVHNLAEMARFFYNFNAAPGDSGWATFGGLVFGFATNATDGGDTSYVFGSKKAYTYRFTPNFTVDRFCNTQGLLGKQKGRVTDISFQPKNNQKKYMVLAMLFSTGLLAFDLVLHYKLNYKTSKGEEKLWVSVTMLAMSIFEFICLTLMQSLEKKCFYAVETLAKGIPVLKERIDAAEKELKIAENTFSDLILLQKCNHPFVDEVLLKGAQNFIDESLKSFDRAKANHKNALDNVNSAW
ncbi:MAG: hypothetical protein WCN98_19550 [Verrucomicrobiaceae bacterium]